MLLLEDRMHRNRILSIISNNNPDSWKKLPEKFKSKAERDRHANRLLEQTLIIED